MREVKGVIFDMDGVLVHSNPSHKEIINDFLKRHNREITDDFLQEKVYGRTNQEWIPHVFGHISDEQITELTEEKEQMFRDAFDPLEHVVAGVQDFIKELKKYQVKLVVATSAPKENADFIIEKLGIAEDFDEILHARHVSHSKPHPEPYQKAAELVDLNTEECVVFEDSISGVESALKAGCGVIGITTTHSRQELDNCHLVVDDFTELKPEQVLNLELSH